MTKLIARRKWQVAAVPATLILGIGLIAPAAHADLDTNMEAVEATSLVEELTPANEEITLAPTKQIGDELVTKDGKVEISPDASEGTDLKLPGGLEITIAPVAERGSGDGEIVDGQSVTEIGEDASVVTQPTEDGVRMVSVLETSEADMAVDYALDLPANITLVANEEGGFYIAEEREAVEQPIEGATIAESVAVAEIQAPWAVDADGNPVDTHYVYNGVSDTLTQVVTPDADTVFPVAADPSIDFHRPCVGAWRIKVCVSLGATVYWNWHETKAIQKWDSSGQWFSSAGCGLIGTVAGAGIGVAPCVAGVQAAWAYLEWLVNTKRCLSVHIKNLGYVPVAAPGFHTGASCRS